MLCAAEKRAQVSCIGTKRILAWSGLGCQGSNPEKLDGCDSRVVS